MSQVPLPAIPQPAAAPTQRQVWLRWLAGLAVGALFTWWSAKAWPLDALLGGSLGLGDDLRGHLALRSLNARGDQVWAVDLSAIGIYAIFLTIIHWLRVLRWKPLLEPYASVPLRALNRVGAVGFMAVFLLPLRLGELTRPLMLARHGAGHKPVRFAAGLGTIALERVLDGLLVTGLLFVVLLEIHPLTLARFPQVQIGAWASLAVFTTALGGLVATLVAREFTLRWTRRIIGAVSAGLAEKVIGLVTAFVDGLAVLKSPWHIVQFIGLTVVYWGVNGLGVWLFARGFDIQMPVVAAYAMMSCVVVGMMIPNAPANAGSFWTFLLLPAGLYGVDDQAPRTIAFALGLWFAQTLQVAVFGIWGSWADARAMARQARLDAQAKVVKPCPTPADSVD